MYKIYIYFRFRSPSIPSYFFVYAYLRCRTHSDMFVTPGNQVFLATNLKIYIVVTNLPLSLLIENNLDR